MTCPKCGSLSTCVVDSRRQIKEELVTVGCPTCGQPVEEMVEAHVVMRARLCYHCGLRYKTYERVDLESYLDREYQKAGIPPKERL